jgi:SH3-like domain-containing protein
LADSLKRHLLITRRRIPLEIRDDYAALWRDVQRVVAQEGGRAWIFRSATDEDRYTEFVEWESDGHNDTPVGQTAINALETEFPSDESDTWMEARL